jgi:uncharacterized iron-regulated protein
MNIKSYLNIFILFIFIVLVLFFAFASNSHPYKQVLRIRDGKVIDFSEMIDELKNVNIVFIGEQHDNKKHHKAQLAIIKGIKKSEIPLSICLEMFRAEDQEKLDRWTEGDLELDAFLRIYYDYWRLPWPLYRNIFLFSRDNNVPMVGLNVPKKITKKVSQDGFKSLSDEDLEKLPPGITCDELDEKYREFIKTAYEVHEAEGKEFEFFCEAQMVWDKAMAWHLLKHMEKEPDRIMVVLSGIGHSWKQGIPGQVRKQADYTFRVILPELPGRADSNMITQEHADYLLLG